MKRYVKKIVFLCLILFTSVTTAFSKCGTVANDLSLTLPCAKYGGASFSLTLKYYNNPTNPGGLYWQFGTIGAAAQSSSCAQVDPNLHITAPCLYFAGANLSVELVPYANPADPVGMYWKMGNQITVNPATISGISGDTTPCFDSTLYSSPEFQASLMASMTCAMNCNQDPGCLMQCMPDLGLGSPFSLAFTFENPSTSPVTFTIPAGAHFTPNTADVQPMLVITDQIITVEPTSSKTVCIPTYCMDGQASSPSSSDIFSVGDIVQNPCLKEIIELLRGTGDISQINTSIIQDAVWSCMETGAITSKQKKDITSM